MKPLFVGVLHRVADPGQQLEACCRVVEGAGKAGQVRYCRNGTGPNGIKKSQGIRPKRFINNLN